MNKTYRLFDQTSMKLGIFFFVLIIFISLRSFQLQRTWYFHNDMARDALVLNQWLETGKPPLLGPTTSALYFNQTALYYYILMPFFLLSGQSYYFAFYSVIVYYLLFNVFGSWYFRGHRASFYLFQVLFLLISIHPQQVLQSRYVWNPSFISPLVLTSVFFFLRLQKKFNWKYLFLYTGPIALAVSFNLSVIPVFLSLLLLSLFLFRFRFVKVGFVFILSFLVANFPTIVFEVRHGFIVSRTALKMGILAKNPHTFVERFFLLNNYIFHFSDSSFFLIICICLFVAVIFLGLRRQESRFSKLIPNSSLLQVSILLLMSFFITLVLSRNIFNHYIFGILSLFFLLIVLMPKKYMVVLVLIYSFFWLHPRNIDQYLVVPPRTISQLKKCFSFICQRVSQPVFVVNQSPYHYHNAPEHNYVMKRSGCDVQFLSQDFSAANQMFVVADRGDYTHRETAFNELTQFNADAAKEVSIYTCSESLKVHLLRKEK